MFHDFENNLREMGFGDIAVNTRMKKFISAFYGRILSYSNSYVEFKKNKSKISEEEIEKKITERNNARKNKDYKAADEIRNELLDKGVLIEDKDDKTLWKFK